MLKNHLEINYMPLSEVLLYEKELRVPSKNQIEKTKRLIEECGFVIPIIVDADGTVIVGAHIFEAAKQLQFDEIPVVKVDHLTSEQTRILRIAHDRIAEDASWNKDALVTELRELEVLIPDLDFTITGFEMAEIDLMFDVVNIGDEDPIPEVEDGDPVTQLGDIWILGDHKLICGDALDANVYSQLMGNERAQMCFTDAPYNVKIDGHVGNSGKIKHNEFVMASGEMDQNEFTQFLTKAHQNMADYAMDGAILYSCMDWRHLPEILAAGKGSGLNMVNLCVWAKDNGGMGSLYRSRHELVLVFKKGQGKHINNIELGKHGRYRTNVWEYPGVNSFGGNRMDDLKMHPTVKPLAMVMDAVKDCSLRGGLILDPFGGSGTTLIAAEKAGRQARLIELDPHYCDVIVRRWQQQTEQNAVHQKSGKTYNEVKEMSHG